MVLMLLRGISLCTLRLAGEGVEGYTYICVYQLNCIDYIA